MLTNRGIHRGRNITWKRWQVTMVYYIYPTHRAYEEGGTYRSLVQMDTHSYPSVHRREKRGLLSCKPWVWEGNYNLNGPTLKA